MSLADTLRNNGVILDLSTISDLQGGNEYATTEFKSETNFDKPRGKGWVIAIKDYESKKVVWERKAQISPEITNTSVRGGT